MEKSNSFIAMEHDILKFWEDNNCYEKRKEKNKGKERFRFIDGPITANNPMGVHHTWGRTLKDTYITPLRNAGLCNEGRARDNRR